MLDKWLDKWDDYAEEHTTLAYLLFFGSAMMVGLVVGLLLWWVER